MPFDKKKLIPWIIDIFFLFSLLFVPVLWIFQPITFDMFSGNVNFTLRIRYIILPLFLIILRVILRKYGENAKYFQRSLLEFSAVKFLVLFVASTIMFVALLEKGLTIIDYSAEMPPIIFELTDEDGKTEKRQGYADPELIFAFRKGEKYHGVPINSLGYRDREVNPQKADGAMRVVCMGDSVTAQGNPGYCGYLHEMLKATPPTNQPWEAFNMAVYGYSSVQGLRVFQLQTRNLAPDIVTLFYGWNDHWPEMQKDRDRMSRKMSKLYGTIYEQLQDKLSFKLLHNLIIHGDMGSRIRNEPGFRVPPEEYKNTLKRFVEEIRNVGAEPLIITAPRRDVFPSKKRYSELNIDYNEVHDEYVEYTLEISKNENVEVLDLHKIFSVAEYDVFFSADGIHFNQEGLNEIAILLYDKIRKMNLENKYP
jgi:lysophospholipase L1-like esterase